MWIGSINCTQALKNLVSPGTSNNTSNGKTSQDWDQQAIYAQAPEGQAKQTHATLSQIELFKQKHQKKITLDKLNPSNSKQIIITTPNKSIYVACELRKSILSRAANLVSQGKAKIASAARTAGVGFKQEQYVDSSYIRVDQIKIEKAEVIKRPGEIQNLLYLLELLSLRYPQTSDTIGDTVRAESNSDKVFDRLKREIIDELQKTHSEIATLIQGTTYNKRYFPITVGSVIGDIKDVFRDER